ncbi:MAG: ABC transporter substrate-binding protein [Bacteroidota bacterium]
MRNIFLHPMLYLIPLLVLGTEQREFQIGPIQEDLRIISLSGFLTEMLFELGYGEQIVARDVTSTYPAAAHALPNLGHVTQLNAEAILQAQPDYVFVEKSQWAQAEALRQLEGSGIKIVQVPTSRHLKNAIYAATHISKHLQLPEDKFLQLKEQIETDSLALQEVLAQYSARPSVLFIYARGTNRILVGGSNTDAAAMIEKAGGRNAIQSFDNFRALSPEALIEASPEVILMFESGLASLDGKEGLALVPGISHTPAFQNNRIIAMDGHYLMAFGPRVGKAALDLSHHIHQ